MNRIHRKMPDVIECSDILIDQLLASNSGQKPICKIGSNHFDTVEVAVRNRPAYH